MRQRRPPHPRKPPPGDPSDPEGLLVWLTRYLGWLRQHNYSPYTVQNRERALGAFLAWCEVRGIGRPTEVTPPILARYQRHLYRLRGRGGKPLSFRSQSAQLVCVRAYFKWLTRHHVLLYNPASELELPRGEQRLPQSVLTVAEAEAVLAQPDVEKPLGLRDRAMLETLYSTGVRRMELLGLGVYDLDAERGTLMVRQGKGNKDRMIPIGERATAWVEKYQSEARPGLVAAPDGGTLFVTAAGKRFQPDHLSQLVRRYVLAAELGKRGGCHLFRHTMATLMLENGADIRFIQEMLGHAKLSTTQIYTQVSIRKLKEIHTATHPTAKLGGQRTEPRDGDAEPTADDLDPSLAADAAEEEAPRAAPS